MTEHARKDAKKAAWAGGIIVTLSMVAAVVKLAIADFPAICFVIPLCLGFLIMVGGIIIVKSEK